MSHLLVTNDFPPKQGGIQSYLWELWRRLPPDETTVLTAAHRGAASWDPTQPMRIERTADVEPALKEALRLKDRTVFLDFQTDPTENVWPMVQAGKGITEMLLGSEDL